MKSTLLMISLLAALPAFAADGARVTGSFRIVKPDGATVLAQAPITPAAGASPTMLAIINVKASDAFLVSGGKCAFNVRYDVTANAAAHDLTNRLYDNDALIAQNTHIDVQAGEVKSIWTQPYLVPGNNNVKVVVNAASAHPSIGWVRVKVDGTCVAAPPAAKTPEPKKDTPTTTPPSAGSTAPAAPPPRVTPGSANWNTLYSAWGYSNYATTQLRGKNFARYNDLARLNADLTAAVQSKSVGQDAYVSLMARWKSFTDDAAFKAALAGITPVNGK